MTSVAASGRLLWLLCVCIRYSIRATSGNVNWRKRGIKTGRFYTLHQHKRLARLCVVSVPWTPGHGDVSLHSTCKRRISTTTRTICAARSRPCPCETSAAHITNTFTSIYWRPVCAPSFALLCVLQQMIFNVLVVFLVFR